MHIKIFIAGFISLVLSSANLAETINKAPSHDKIPAVINSKDDLDRYCEQISAEQASYEFPAGLTKEDIIALVAPGKDVSLLQSISAKAWHYRANSFVVIANFVGNDNESIIYFGLLEYKPSVNNLTLIASYGKPLDIHLKEDGENTSDPVGDIGDNQVVISPDLALYKITETDTAIGLRFEWTENYSGGVGSFEALALFKIDGSKLINIFYELTSYDKIIRTFYKDGAGHEKYKSNNVLIVLPSKTQGYFDLQIRTLKSKRKKLFVWDNKRLGYIAVVNNKIKR